MQRTIAAREVGTASVLLAERRRDAGGHVTGSHEALVQRRTSAQRR